MQHQACARACWWAALSICTQVQLNMALSVDLMACSLERLRMIHFSCLSKSESQARWAATSACGLLRGETKSMGPLGPALWGLYVLPSTGRPAAHCLEVEHGCALKGPYQNACLRGVVRMVRPGMLFGPVQPCLVTCPAKTAGWRLPLPSLNPGLPAVTAACPPAGCTHLSAPGDDPAL